MRILLISLLVFLITAGSSAPGIAATANHAEDAVTFKTGVPRTVPICKVNEVLTHNGQMLVCTPNFPTQSCPPPSVIKNIYDDGHVDCTTAVYPAGISCPAANQAIVSVDTTTTPPTVVCKTKTASPPPCSTLQTLTSTSSGMACVSATKAYPVPMWALTAKNSGCTAATAIFATGEYGGNIFSSWCISACHRWCKDQTFGIYRGGVMTSMSGPDVICACSK